MPVDRGHVRPLHRRLIKAVSLVVNDLMVKREENNGYNDRSDPIRGSRKLCIKMAATFCMRMKILQSFMQSHTVSVRQTLACEVHILGLCSI